MRRLIPLGLLLAIIAVYANALHGPFVCDDLDSVVGNHFIRTLWPPNYLDITTIGAIGGRPLVALSFALNYAAGELNPIGYHIFNISIHIACALLLFGVIRRTMILPTWQGRFDSKFIDYFAGTAALLWGLHPIQTEAVDYVSQRSETMMSMFLLLVIYSVARSAQSNRPIAWIILAIVASALGMACKQTMVVAPFLVLLYHWTFLPRRLPGRRILFSGLICTWLVVVVAMHDQNVEEMNPTDGQHVSSWLYLQTQAGVIVHYLRLTFWPRGLTIDYRDWPVADGIRSALLPGSFLLLLLTATVIACIRRQWQGFAGAWFFLILAPSSSVFPLLREIAAERRMYLPLAAIVVLVLAELWQLFRSLFRASAPIVATIAILSVAVVLGASSSVRNRDFRSALALWSDAVQKRPNSPVGHYYLCKAYADAGDFKNARIQDNITYELIHGKTPRSQLPWPSD